MADVKSNPAYQIGQLLEKMNSTDKDFRFMATSDLITEVNKNNIKLDEDSERKVIRMLIKLLHDKNGEVQNLAVKCLGTLASRVKETSCDYVVDQLCEYLLSKTDEHRDVSSMALRQFVGELPSGAGGNATRVALRLLPRLHLVLNDKDVEATSKLEVFDIVGDVLLRNGSALASFHQATEQVLLHHLVTDRPAVKKRAILALGHLAGVCAPPLYDDIVTKVLAQLQSPKPGDLRILVSALTALVKARSSHFAPFIATVTPILLNYVQSEDDELSEASIQCLESMTVRCPRESAPFFSEMEVKFSSALTHDPNYAYDEADNGEEMETEGDSEEEEEEEEDYEDDDDLSWKVRRAAAKAIENMVETRREHLGHLFETFGPLLITRFKEREENVRGDIFSAYAALLKEFKKAVPSVKDDASNPLVTLLQSQLPSLLRSVTRLLKAKNAKVRHNCFCLLQHLSRALGSSLDSDMSAVLDAVCSTLSDRNCPHNIRIDVLSFLNEALRTHSPSLFQSHSGSLVNLVAKALADPFYKVSAEALVVSANLLLVLKGENDSQAMVQQINEATVAKLKGDVDQEVKEKALHTLGVLIDLFGLNGGTANESLSLLVARLNNEATRHAAVRALCLVSRGEQSACLLSSLPTLLPVLADILRKNARALKLSTLELLLNMVSRHSGALSPEDCASFVSVVPPLLSETDLQISQRSFKTLSAVAENCPSSLSAHLPALLSSIVSLTQSALLQGTTLVDLLDFVSALVKANIPGKPSFEALLDQLSAPIYDVAGLPRQSFISISAASAAVAAASETSHASKLAVKLADQLSSNVTDAVRLFSLITLGELGKRCPAVFESARLKPENIITEAFKSSNEDVKSAAAHSLGCLAVGNLAVYLPFILNQINSQPKRQYLLLHALKEVIASETGDLPCSAAFMQQLDSVWTVLVKHADCPEEGTRCVVAECLGKLAHADPATLLPRLKEYVKSESVNMRAAVVTSVKFMISDEKRPIDDVLQTMMSDFLAAAADSNLDVRRVALVVLNSAAHNKPELIRSRLQDLLPIVYGETNVRLELIREVEMGPFKHTVDGGLDLRKSAFECMYTLLDTCLDRLDIFEFIGCVENGLRDQHDIKLLCCLTLNKMAAICPAQLMQRMDKVCEPLKVQLNAKPKANAVKQEQDKADELKRAVLRTLLSLQKMPEADRQQHILELTQLVRHSPDLKTLLESIQKDAQRTFPTNDAMDTAA